MGFFISLGNSGLAVYKIQQYLNLLRSSYPALPTLEPDTIYGKQTQSAIAVFQSLTGLESTGIVDSLTWDKLIQKILTQTTKTETIVSDIHYGSQGLDVFKIQGYLNMLFPTSTPLVLDGQYGAKTEARIIQFQIQQGIKASGKVDTETWNRIISII